MSKRFTDVATALALSLTLTACVSLDNSPSSMPSSASTDPSDQSVDLAVNSEITPGSLAADAPPPPEVRRHNALAFEQAVDAMREGRLEQAEVLLLEITGDQPELAGPWINLGQVYAGLGQPEEARRAFERAIESNPWNCDAHNELGVLSRRSGDFDGAERHYLECLARVPAFPNAYLNLGILYELYLGRLEDALELYRRYQSLQDEPDPRVQGWVLDLERRLGV
jgi:tetratricopeptide (TPR) repeat protein